MKIWLVDLSYGSLTILDRLDELDCEVRIMYDISNHTPQWLSCSDEAFTRLKLTHPELILVAFDEEEFEAAADAAAINSPMMNLNKYSCLALLHI